MSIEAEKLVVPTKKLSGPNPAAHIMDEFMDWFDKYAVKRADHAEPSEEPVQYSPYYGVNYKSNPFKEQS